MINASPERGARALSCALLASTVLSANAPARECRGVAFPDRIRVDASDLSLNGLGVRKATFLKVNVYVAALYVARPTHDVNALIASNEPQELILHFVRNVGANDLKRAWTENFARIAPTQIDALRGRFAMLNSWMTDVKSGQRFTFLRRPGVGIQVSIAGALKGTISGDDFARAFLAIWLGPNPPHPELRAGLLGGPCG